ncbi:hypothetical protein DY120_00705 [Apilactobacillus micheneri]|uniref:Uncharacterized protein n=1 Tax=Apilactobacillus micheneri TaxID=1899430 RepID=A0ABY2YYS2_9LACO|nr:hypothetical protein [Apilactobacillus micheneri]TPR26250.1 hypothetical protein DY114_00705 [Apilactobacillus micheneri]TPR27004.1 hypothetical protein DY111_00705 [Apilactobacillus micheneri]TPR27862.1 hypothetical protein DY113_04480 [Apilactobacillus micheneri]TPR31767.1 hypothetical protein DY117_00705 [Apilactobacillus micheneri]TPR32171.1 hypothetical protein DY120_00705 [Apilactobacillus micheneri]
MNMKYFRNLIFKEFARIDDVETITDKDVGMDSTMMYKNELDPMLLPVNFDMGILPNEIVMHAYVYEDFVGYIITDININILYLMGIAIGQHCEWSTN